VPRAHALGLFLFATFGLDAALALGFALLGGRYEGKAVLVLGVATMWTPLLVGAVLTRWGWKLPLRPVLALRVRPNRFYVAAWLLPVLVVALTVTLALALPGVTASLDMHGFAERLAPMLDAAQRTALDRQLAEAPLPPWLLITAQALFAGLTVNALAALGEEAGWRGYLYAVFEGSFWRASLVTGLVWGLWHTPLVLLGHNAITSSVGVNLALTVLWCVLVAPLFTWVRARSGSTVAAAILHGTLNALAGVPLLFLRGGSALAVGPLGLSWQLATALVVALVVAYDWRLGPGSIVRPGSPFRTGPSPA
jgi:membrane protease YdiL (CAAX protease family)